MKRILVGVDGSKESRDAAKFAADLARATGCQLIIASAVVPIIPTEQSYGLAERARVWQEKEREEAQAAVKQIASALGPELVVETAILDGAPAVALAELARLADVEFVVVGHRGRNAVARALLGSVADRLVQLSSKPVLVFR